MSERLFPGYMIVINDSMSATRLYCFNQFINRIIAKYVLKECLIYFDRFEINVLSANAITPHVRGNKLFVFDQYFVVVAVNVVVGPKTWG